MIYNVDGAQILYWKFINDNMNPAPRRFSVTVKGPNYYQDTLDVWGYGNKGYAYVKDGVISMSNVEDKYFSSDEYAVLLVKYPSNTFNTDNYISSYNTFEDFYERAEEGSFVHNHNYNYNYDNKFETVYSIIFRIVTTIIIILPF